MSSWRLAGCCRMLAMISRIANPMISSTESSSLQGYYVPSPLPGGSSRLLSAIDSRIAVSLAMFW